MQRNDDDLIDLPSITLDRDDVDLRNEPPLLPVEKPKSGGNGMLWVFSIVLLLALIGFGYLGFTQLQQSQTALADANKRILFLEEKLNLTDESLNQSGATLQDKLTALSDEQAKQWSEIKKLWAVSNERNKEDIAANKKAVTDLTAKMTKVADSDASATKKVKSLQSSLNKLSASVKQQATEVSGLGVRVQVLDDSVKKLGNSGNVSQRLRALEEDIQAIDASRTRVNQQLLDLQRRVNQLQGGA